MTGHQQFGVAVPEQVRPDKRQLKSFDRLPAEPDHEIGIAAQVLSADAVDKIQVRVKLDIGGDIDERAQGALVLGVEFF